jgi:hypothetical protein
LRGYVGPDDGYIVKALRISSAAFLLMVLAAGCGGAAGQQRSAFHGVPPALARDWEARASDIATAASAGNSCHALTLAKALRSDVVASKDRVPPRLRRPLLSSVRSLAHRVECTPVVQTPTTGSNPTKEPKPPEKHKPKEPHEHDQHGHHGHGDGGHDK